MSAPRPGGSRPGTHPRTGKLGRRTPIDRERFVDGDRRVEFVDDDTPTLPDQTRDDTDAGWGERAAGDDDWLRDQRPPHWDG
jgi:hypothetical protein